MPNPTAERASAPREGERVGLAVVIVNARVEQAEAICRRFEKRFSEVDLKLELATSALYALTTLERYKPHLIVSGAEVGDMSGRDFYDIVRADASLNEIPFILLSPEAPRSEPGEQDARLGADVPPTEVVRTAFKLLTAAGQLVEEREDLRRALGPRGASRAASEPKKEAHGTLEVLSLFDLALSLGQSKQSGKLSLFLNEEATLFFSGGRLAHASIGGAVGEEAVRTIFAEAQRKPDAEFFFVSSEFEPSVVTVRTPLNELLIKLALEFDQQRSNHFL